MNPYSCLFCFVLSAGGDSAYQNSTFNYGYDLSLCLEALSIATENTFFVHTYLTSMRDLLSQSLKFR